VGQVVIIKELIRMWKLDPFKYLQFKVLTLSQLTYISKCKIYLWIKQDH